MLGSHFPRMTWLLILNISVFFGAATGALSATAAATGTLSTAERSYPMSEVRGRSREDPMPEGRWPKGVTPCLRSGAAAKSAESDSAGMAERRYPMSEVRGSGQEELPHT